MPQWRRKELMAMAYKSIDPVLKMETVKHYYSCSKISKTSMKYGISRNSVYEWSRYADEVLLKAFREKTPGKRTATLEEQVSTLKEQIRYLLEAYHKISQGFPPQPKPVICSTCGSTELCRNGKVMTKCHGIRQRWICRRCSVSIYVDLKKTP